MLKGLYILDSESYAKIYSPQIRQEIEKYVHIYAPVQTRETLGSNLSLLNDADVIFSGWGGVRMDEPFLQAASRLKVVFYGAGSIKGVVTDSFWNRQIAITSAYAANAVPVAEYTLSQLLFLLKGGWHFAMKTKADGKFPPKKQMMGIPPGGYGSKVGIISLGLIGRLVCEHLRNFDVQVLAYDPFIAPQDAAKLNVQLCSLEEIFEQADVVSLHAPKLEATLGLITGKHFASMKPGASFINTSRGAIIREDEMIEVLTARPDLYAVLDVTHPEPPIAGSPLYTLPNVVLTPHIAGSAGAECQRMGAYMLEELKRYCNGEPLKWGITAERAKIMA